MTVEVYVDVVVGVDIDAEVGPVMMILDSLVADFSHVVLLCEGKKGIEYSQLPLNAGTKVCCG